MNLTTQYQVKPTMLSLGYLGLLPFVIGLWLIASDSNLFNVSGELWFVSYSAIILSFLSGALWGNGIDHSSAKLSRSALLLSNLFALLAWGALLGSSQSLSVAVILLACGYGLVWFAEQVVRKTEKEDKPTGYQSMRAKLTATVILLHCVALIA